MKIGIRKEDKGIWERRSPFVPEDIRAIREKGIDMVVESNPGRVFSDTEYVQAGVPVQSDLNDCDMIFGIKEIPPHKFEKGKIYLFFAHVIKGQPHNMPMLRQMMAQETTLIDYERVMDDWNRRLIFFGRHAGLAGMINGLWALGKRLKREGMDNPFTQVRQARTYTDLNEVRTALEEMAGLIRQEGIPDSLHPLIIGITGYGNVSKGAQEILDLLPVQEISPHEIASLMANPSNFSKVMYKSVFKEEHSVKPIDSQAVFDLQDYYRSGKKSYENAFTPYLDSVTLLVNCVYWDNRYPRLLTREDCKTLWQEGKKPRLRVIADISCDIQGAVECTLKSTDPGNPVYVYHPQTGEITEGFDGHGPVIMAVDILPSELPRESSVWFSHVLTGFIESLAKADFSVDFDKLDLIPELKRAVILHHGRLTPDYEYIQQFL